MLVSVPEFRQAMNGVDLTEPQTRDVERLLSGVQQDLEIFLNRPVEPVLVREWVVADSSGLLRLSVTPVQQVLSVTRRGEDENFSPDGYARNPIDRPDEISGRIRAFGAMGLGTSRINIVPGGISGLRGGMFGITYVGGISPDTDFGWAIDSIKRKILEIATRTWTARNVIAIGLRDGEATQPNSYEGNPGWAYDELLAYDRLRRRVVR